MNESDKGAVRRDLLKAALLRIEALEAKLAAHDAVTAEIRPAGAPDRIGVAVIGLACRFPGGAETPEAFWQLLRDGRDGVADVPRERWDVTRWYDPTPATPGRLYTQRGGFISGVGEFDPYLFGISPREAGSLDPQQRLLLETVWEALERAAIAPDSLTGSPTSVFVGMSSHDFALMRATPGAPAMDTYSGAGIAHSMASGRLSYVLGLRGPSVTVDTACSSSLVALHLAVQSLRSGESRLAIAAGVNVMLGPSGTIAASQARMLSPGGACRTFDDGADGYVRSEGVAAVVLKPLAAAMADGDPILAIIRGSASNQDGRSNGLTAPNGRAQEAVVRAALDDASLTPSDVSYVETHGTGTSLGDPIEVEALSNVFRESPATAPAGGDSRKVAIGAVKTNIGHLEAAAGLAGLIKVVLALTHRELPPTLHFRTPNRLVDWNRAPVRVVAAREPWSTPRRIAGLSSFGFSGTNVHVVLEEAPALPAPLPHPVIAERPRHVLALSAATLPALRELARRYARHLREQIDDTAGTLADVCFSAATTRAALSHRLAVTGATRDEIAARLSSAAVGDTAGVVIGEVGRGARAAVKLIFDDAVAADRKAAAQLYAGQPAFREAFGRCAALVHARTGRSILGMVGDGATDGQGVCSALDVFAVQYSLAALWRAWGVEPVDAQGRGAGARAAAVVTRQSALDEAIALVAALPETDRDEQGPEDRTAPAGSIALVMDVAAIPEMVARLHVSGAAFDWRGFDAPFARRRVALPTYAFDRDRFPLPSVEPPAVVVETFDSHPTLGRGVRAARGGETIFEMEVAEPLPSYIADHVMFGAPLFPASAYVAILYEAVHHAATATAGGDAVEISDLRLHQPLAFNRPGRQRLQVSRSSPDANGEHRLEVHSAIVTDEEPAAPAWTLHATAAGRIAPGAAASNVSSLESIRARCEKDLNVEEFYSRLSAAGAEYAAGYRLVTELRLGRGEAIGRLAQGAAAAPGRPVATMPAVLDAALQVVGALSSDQAASDDQLFLPIGVERIRIARAGSASGPLWVEARVDDRRVRGDGTLLVTDVALYDAAGHQLATISGFAARRTSAAALRRALPARSDDDLLYELEWRQAPAAASSGAPSSWLVLNDRSALSERVVRAWRDAGGLAQAVADEQLESTLRTLVTSAATDSRYGILVLSTLDLEPQVPDAPASGFDGAAARLLRIVQRVLAVNAPLRPGRMIVATRGACAVNGESLADGVAMMAQAAAAGLARSVISEHPDLDCRVVDLDPSASEEASLEHLIAEMAHSGSVEELVSYRLGVRQAPRLVRARPLAPRDVVPSDTPFELTLPRRGSFDHLTFAPAAPRAPVDDEVQIRVTASSLNFRDVLNALGMYPGDAGPPGSECVGVVSAIGPAVAADPQGVRRGDRVMALTDRAFSTYAIGRAPGVHRTPAGLSDGAAATLPTAYLTAIYALERFATLKAGERVLIHAAAGGVGLAAVHVAKRAGAEIFATAGSPIKREFLASLGVAHVMDSRSTDFAAQIRELTGGEGIDVVLNSLTGPAIDASLSMLRAGGRFVEIGKTDCRDPQAVAAAWPGVTYAVLDVGSELSRDPAAARTAVAALVDAVERGVLPPLPRRRFALADVRDAFRFMAQAKQIGKVVVLHPPTPGAFRADGSYLVTGGLGGVGLSIARWLAEHGAGRLWLMGRSSPGADALAEIARIEAAGASVTVVQGDASRSADIVDIVARMPAGAPLRGVVHAAGVLDDAAVVHLNEARLARVIAPKAAGAWALHRATLDLDLDWFMLCSAGAALFGSPTQGNYVAANAALDALAHYRRGQGLPALSLDWGPWSEVGMAARLDVRVRARWQSQGIGMMTPAAALQAFDRALRRDAAQLAVLAMDWALYARQGARMPALLTELVAGSGRAAVAAVEPAGRLSPGHGDGALTVRLQEAPVWERRELLREHLRTEVRAVLGLAPGFDLRGDRGLSEVGMDSLMAVELSSRLQASLGRVMPATLTFERPTIDDLTAYILESGALPETSAPAKEAGDDTVDAAALEKLKALTDDEVSQQLLRELDLAGY